MNSSAQFIRVTGVGSRASAPSLARCLENVSVRLSVASHPPFSPLAAADDATVSIIGPAGSALGEVVTLKLRSP